MNSETPGRVLVLTVGTGDLNRLDETVLAPFRKSIAQGAWSQIVLLPSSATAENANMVGEEISQTIVIVRPLRDDGAEDDADRCFSHFDSVIDELRSNGIAPESIEVDFTRGTKAMSAALVLAAYRHGIPLLRYITGTRDERGQVVTGGEIVRDFPIRRISSARRLDLAADLMCHGNFAAVLRLLPDPDHAFAKVSTMRDERAGLRCARALAAFFSEWDRLDYRAAANGLGKRSAQVPQAAPKNWNRFTPPDAAVAWVKDLAKGMSGANNKERSLYCRMLAVDLLANAERRLRDRQLEDAFVRVYRVAELVGQASLFGHGVDSEKVPGDRSELRELREELAREGRQPFAKRADGTVPLGRENVARLLTIMKDPIGEYLTRIAGELPFGRRNNSILVHGFEARAPEISRIDAGLEKLRDLARRSFESSGKFDEVLEVARTPAFDRQGAR